MKKFLTLLLSLMLSLSCIGLIACGGEEGETGEGAGNTPGGSQVTYTVTEAQFNSAFDIYGAPFQVTATEGEGADIYTAVVNYVPGKIYEKETEGTYVDEKYYSKEGDKYYKYVKEDGEWLKLDADSYVNVLDFYNPMLLLEEDLNLTLTFGDLTYDQTAKIYVYTSEFAPGITLNVGFAFENAKLVKFNARLGNDLEAEVIEFRFTYNNTPVNLPVIGGGESGGDNVGGGESGGNENPQYTVTESQFNQAINPATYSQFMVVGENTLKENGVVNSLASSTLKYIIVADGSYTEVSGQEIYMQKVGSEYFGYQKADGVWQKIPINQMLYDSNRQMILNNASPAAFIGNYGITFDAITFNDTENCYVYSPKGEEGISATIKIFFENGKVMKVEMVATNTELQEEISSIMNYTYSNVTITYPSVGGGESGGDNVGGGESSGDSGVVGGDSSCQHVWQEVSLNNGIMTYSCPNCKASKTENKTQLYKSVTANIADTVFALADGASLSANGYSVSLFSDYTWQDADWSTVHSMNVKGVVMFVKMLSQMMDNPNFNITSAPVIFSYSYPALGETGVAILLYDFDVENDKVTMYWDVDSTSNGIARNIYMYIDVTYDFDTNTLVGFNLSSNQQGDGQSTIFGYNYYDNNLRVTKDAGYLEEVNLTRAELNAVKDTAIDLKADFTEEYSNMMDIMNGNAGGGDENPQGYTVTEDQFNDAINQANYTQFMVDGVNTLKVNGVIDPNQSNTIKYVIVADGSYTAVSGQEIYMQKVGSEYFGYQNADGVWQKMSINQNTYDSNRQRILSNASPAAYINGFGLTYDMLAFNDTENCYVYSPKGEEGISATIKVFFENGKIMKVEMVAINTELQEEISSIMNYTYSNVAITYPSVEGGNQGEIPIDPNPGETPEEQKAYTFKFKSIVIMGKECFVGDTIYNLTITEDFATLVLNYDYSAHMVTSDMTSKGTWQLFGDEIMVELTDDVDTYKFILDYDEVSNVVTFKIDNNTYKFDMPNGVSYGDIVGEVEMMYANLGKIVVGEKEFTVGDTVNERVLTADSAYIKIFMDGRFKLFTATNLKIYGTWSLNKADYTILATYEFDDEVYTTTVTMMNNGATFFIDLTELEGFTYYLNVSEG